MLQKNTNWFVYVYLSLALFIIGICKYLISAVIGDKGFEPDSYLHFLQAKTIYMEFPSNLEIGIDVWAKPLYTFIHGLWLFNFDDPTLIDAKLFNIIVFAAISFLVYLIAKTLRLPTIDAFAAAIISNIGFLSLRSSITVLTEPIFTLLFFISILLWVKNKHNLSALILGIAVLGRLEALLFVAIWSIYELYKNYKDRYINITFYFLLLAPVTIWNAIGAAKTGKILYLFSNGYPTETGVYGFGHPLTYIEGLVAQEGMLFAFAILGIALLLKEIELDKSKWKVQLENYLNDPMMFLVNIFIIFNVAQAFLYTFGLFGTAGLMRYLIPVLPLMPIFAVKAIRSVPLKDEKWLVGFYIVFVIFYGFGSVSILRNGGFYKGLDNRPNVNQEFIDIWEDPSMITYKEDRSLVLITNRPEIIYYSGYDLQDAAFIQDLRNIPRGSLVVVDSAWLEASGLSLDDITSQRDIVEVDTVYTYSDVNVYIK